MGDGADVDYSDFEYQQIDVALRVQPTSSGSNQQAAVVYDIEPLGDIGGLANNEVAELAYMETYAGMEFEDENDDQNVGTAGECRGAVGINLPASDEAFPSDAQQSNPKQAQSTLIQTQNTTESELNANSSVSSDDRFLQLYRAREYPPFDDETTGPGGGGSHDQFFAVKNWRELTGRGPVLDANDDIGISLNVNVGDSIIGVAGNVRCHMIWDVAETDDAGRRFSVPE
jgi:hypothetical protein